MAEGNIEYKKWKVPAYLLSIIILFGYFVAMIVAMSLIPIGPFNKPEFLISTISSSQTSEVTLGNGVKVIMASFDNGVARDSIGISVAVGSAYDPANFPGRSNTFKEEVKKN
ncbi:MAG: hypothetical protein V2I33_25860 [Kangiellaceae bacterium]|jgi:hypothetical protein|nr:hypothetical protein [Kangiellaceae bacterium]